MPTFSKYLFISWCLMGFTGSKAAVCISTGNGSWSNSATWSCGSVPTCGDSLIIQAGHTVSITAVNLTACGTKVTLIVKGTLQFVGVGKLQLSCLGRVYVLTGGQVVAAPGNNGNDNALMTCGSTWWNAGAGVYEGPGCMPPSAGDCATVLPVSLLGFQAASCGREVCITWTTVAEFRHDFFEIQRAGEALDFSAIGRINAVAGSGSMRRAYHFVDSFPLPGLNYYRLKQADLDGSVNVYQLKAVRIKPDAASPILIFPNPGKGSFTIRMEEGFQLPVDIVISDGRGVQLAAFQARADHGQEVFVQPPLDLPNGIYFCNVKTGIRFGMFKLIVE